MEGLEEVVDWVLLMLLEVICFAVWLQLVATGMEVCSALGGWGGRGGVVIVALVGLVIGGVGVGYATGAYIGQWYLAHYRDVVLLIDVR